MTKHSSVRIVQIQKGKQRRVAWVDEPLLRLLDEAASIYDLAMTAVASSVPLTSLVRDRVSAERLDYDQIYSGQSDWRLLVPIDHPIDPARCLVSGTGLTHLGSAANRDAMHGKGDHELTDSMRMFKAGLEGGRPSAGDIGTAPEWFYKGTGTILRAHGDPLAVPPYAEDGGEEAEIAGVYVVDDGGRPYRVGMTAGNEFSDHKFERTNYLNLAGSKLRTCSIGPELVVGGDFQTVTGEVAIERAGHRVWQDAITTGEVAMCHNLRNIEHHHFKFDAHRRPGDVHVHFYGAHSLSFGEGVHLQDGDVMNIHFDGFGRPLRNPLQAATRQAQKVTVESLL